MRTTRVTATIGIAVAALLTMAGCSSDPTNPSTADSTTSAPISASSGPATSASSGPVSSGSSSVSGPSSGVTTGTDGEAAEPGQAAAGASGTLNLFMYQKPNGNFNPLAGASGPDNEVISLMYQPLLDIDPATGTLTPVLATALPTVSDDGKTFTFDLKQGLTWSDGSPFTAKDVVATYTAAANPAMDTGPSVSYATVVGADKLSATSTTLSGITAPDDHTVKITLTKPSNGAVDIIAVTRILPAALVSSLPLKSFVTDPYFQAPKVGLGPFVFAQYQTDQFVKMTANPNFRYKVGVKEVYLKILTSDVATQQLQTGELDVSNIAPVDMDTVKGFAGVTVNSVDTSGFVRVAWNQSQDRFKDPRVKQAFLYGTDRKSIVDGALKGQGIVRNSVLGPPWQASDLEQYAYNPDKAKELLKEAGWDSSQEVTLSWIAGGNPDRDAAAQVMQNQLKDVGINIKLNQVQSQWFSDNVPKGQFDMVMYGGGNYTANPYNAIPITSCQEPGKGPNNGLYCNKEWQDAVTKADATPDLKERTAAYQAASKLENADPSQMWMYTPKIVWAVSGKVGNFTPGDLGSDWWQAWKWTKSG